MLRKLENAAPSGTIASRTPTTANEPVATSQLLAWRNRFLIAEPVRYPQQTVIVTITAWAKSNARGGGENDVAKYAGTTLEAIKMNASKLRSRNRALFLKSIRGCSGARS